MSIKESGEMYLETILILSKEKNAVRAIDIAGHMGISKPSVSRALGKLKNEAFVLVDHDGSITFTEAGRAIARTISKRAMDRSSFHALPKLTVILFILP